MLAQLLALIKSLLDSFPAILKIIDLFRKTSLEKEKQGDARIDEEQKVADETGRPV